MKTITENFVESLIMGLILLALALSGAYFLSEKAQEMMTTATERMERR